MPRLSTPTHHTGPTLGARVQTVMTSRRLKAEGLGYGCLCECCVSHDVPFRYVDAVGAVHMGRLCLDFRSSGATSSPRVKQTKAALGPNTAHALLTC